MCTFAPGFQIGSMENILIFSFLILITGIFFVPVRLKYALSLIVILGFMLISSFPALVILIQSEGEPEIRLGLSLFPGITFVIDRLSAFFILTINLTVLTGSLYAGQYLRAYQTTKPPLMLSWHYFNLILLYISMVLVCSVRDAFPFLLSWELMTISSFILVIFDSEQVKNLKTGINYLIQMHLGMFALLTAFLIASGAGAEAGFDGLHVWFANHHPMPVFLLFFVGFGIKAGFIPLHTWLPEAHPAAPSHVSGIMSGVMIKMGIYGIIRVLLSVSSGMMEIGIFLLILSTITAVYGVLQAIVQHDLKKLLAYHSIENIGIIGIGLGLGCIGLGLNNSALALAGFTGGLLHVLNHSLFKSLLFYTAGSVYQQTHTLDINRLGGLMKRMPLSAWFFLMGSVAICGLPPFNGFVSEFLLFSGMFESLPGSGFYLNILLVLAILGLALTGGLAMFCFGKAFSVVFLGEARTENARINGKEPRATLIPFSLIGAFLLLIGLIPGIFLDPLNRIVFHDFSIIPAPKGLVFIQGLNLFSIGITGGLFILLSLLLIALRYLILKNREHAAGPTWGCGYTAGSVKMQYTASSFSDNVAGLAGKLVNVKKEISPIAAEEIFPDSRSFASHASEWMETWFIDKPVQFLRNMLRRLAFLQTGQIRHYILYPFLFILIIFILSLLNLL